MKLRKDSRIKDRLITLKPDMILTCFLFILIIISFSAQSHAELSIYNSESAFLSSALIVSTETFDSFSTGSGFNEAEVVIDGVIYITDRWGATPVPPPAWHFSDGLGNGPMPVTLPNYLSAAPPMASNSHSDLISFGLNKICKAFGFYFHSANSADYLDEHMPNFNGWIIRVKEADGNTSAINIDSGIVGSENTEPPYFGFISNIGIKEIRIFEYGEDDIVYGAHWAYDNVSRSEIEIAYPSILNNFVTLEPDPSTFVYTPDTVAGCQAGSIGTFTFDATLTNTSENEFSNLIIKVVELTQNNLLLTDEGLIGEGEGFEVNNIDDYDDGILSSEENIDVSFTICLYSTDTFGLSVDVAGITVTRFFDIGNGTIRDNKSGLIWLRDASCSDLAGTDSDGRSDWWTATAAAGALSDGTCGLTDRSEAGDWRLATEVEWQEFMSQDYGDPALVNTKGDAQWSEGDAFTGVQSSSYWASNDEGLAGYAVTPSMLTGGTYYAAPKTSYNYVWPVCSDCGRGENFYFFLNPASQVIEIKIDIKPRSYPNNINLKSRGKVPVAILTTSDFDAYDVDPVTCVFAGAYPLRWKMEDVDNDGDNDMLFHFKTQEFNLTEDSTEATLECETLEGMQITDTDSVNIVPKGNGHGNFAKESKKGK